MVKYFVGNKTHFLAFANNLYKDDTCVYVMYWDQIIGEPGDVYMVAGEPIEDDLYTSVMRLYLDEIIDIYVLPESLLYDSKITE